MKKTTLDDWIAGKTGGEDLSAWQLHKLRETLAHAQNGHFWRKKLAGAGPGDIRALKDIEKLPLTTPDELAAAGAGMVCVGQGEISRVVTLQTSGTTGPPKRLWFTEDDQELTRDFFHHGIRGLTDPDDRVLILLPYERPGSIGQLLSEALRRIPATPLPFGVITAQNAGEARRRILEEEVSVVVGIPHQLLWLAAGEDAAEVKRRGALKTVLYATDFVPAPLAGRIEAAWGCRGFEHYGMTEMGLGGGVSCEARSGYHLREADLLFEIIDPASGRALPDGAEGELVFTTLTRRGMPLVRYRTGDRAAFGTAPCPCGSRLRTLRKTSGRAGQALVLPGGEKITLAQLDDALFAAPGLLDYEPVLGRGADAESLAIHYTGDAREEDLHALLRKTPLGALLQSGALGLAFRSGYARAEDSKAITKRTIKSDGQ